MNSSALQYYMRKKRELVHYKTVMHETEDMTAVRTGVLFCEKNSDKTTETKP